MPHVLFIVGAGRSGSTALERLLAQHENVQPLGEMRYVWRQSFGQGYRCSCAEPFGLCPFWAEVRAAAFPPDGTPDLDRVMALADHVDRVRRIPAMHAAGFATADYQRALREYQEVLTGWYRSIHEVSGGRLLVDSSKDPSYAHLLAVTPGIRVVYLHFVRDSRAVAFSRQRIKVTPEVVSHNPARMDIWSARRSAVDWDLKYLESLALKASRRCEVRTMRYEEFAADPAASIDRIEGLLADSGFPGLGRDTGTNSPDRYHTVSGNPNRFDRGTFTVSLDEEWRRQGPSLGRAAVTALTAPLLAWHVHSVSRARRP